MKISIVTPSYNQGRFIERTIQSVLKQNISDLEYFVIDGGSQDETLAILERYSNQLRYVSERDNGQAHAVNKGLCMASGQVMGWLNSDDIYYPNTLQKVREYFLVHSDIDVIYGDAYHIDQNDQIIEHYPTESWNIERLKETCYLSQPTVFWRRSILLKFGLLDESLHYCMDYEYWLRLALQGARFGYLQEIFAGSRLYPETKTRSAPVKATYEALRMLKQRIDYVSTKWLINYAVSFVKHSTKLRFPDARFIVAVGALVFYASFKWNGLLRGLRTCFSLPWVMMKWKVVWRNKKA